MQQVVIKYVCDGCGDIEEVPAEGKPDSVVTHTLTIDGINYQTERCEPCWNNLREPVSNARATPLKATRKPRKASTSDKCDQPGCNAGPWANPASRQVHRRRAHGIMVRKSSGKRKQRAA